MRVAVFFSMLALVACKRPDPEQKDQPKPVEAGGLAPNLSTTEHKGGSLEYLNRTRQKELLTPTTGTSAVDAKHAPSTLKEPGKLEFPNVKAEAPAAWDPTQKKEIVGRSTADSAVEAEVAQ